MCVFVCWFVVKEIFVCDAFMRGFSIRARSCFGHVCPLLIECAFFWDRSFSSGVVQLDILLGIFLTWFCCVGCLVLHENGEENKHVESNIDTIRCRASTRPRN